VHSGNYDSEDLADEIEARVNVVQSRNEYDEMDIWVYCERKSNMYNSSVNNLLGLEPMSLVMRKGRR